MTGGCSLFSKEQGCPFPTQKRHSGDGPNATHGGHYTQSLPGLASGTFRRMGLLYPLAAMLLASGSPASGTSIGMVVGLQERDPAAMVEWGKLQEQGPGKFRDC